MLPIKIGLTGSIGTGKSTVASALEDHGAEITSGDEFGKIVLEQSPGLLEQVRVRFGKDVFSTDGFLLRRELGRRVFASPEHANWITELTFPRIHELWRQAVMHTSRPVIVFDAALIIEWGIAHEFDHLVVVTASSDVVEQRLSSSGRFTSEEIEARVTMQIRPAAKAAMATLLIANDGTIDDLRKQVDQFWTDIIQPEIIKRSSRRDVD